MAVNDLLPAEIVQECRRPRRAICSLINKCLAVAELRQQLIPGRRIVAMQQRLEGLIDLRDQIRIDNE